MKATVAVLRLPGVNCEIETARACAAAGMHPEIVRCNDREVRLEAFDAFVLPGGFSFQDRVRAGVIAANEPVLEIVVDQASAGKPVLGICNGAQVLVECGLVPGLTAGAVEVALAPNAEPGYECRWVFSAASAIGASPFVRGLAREGPIPMPVAHAEGRFTSGDPALFSALHHAGQLAFRYVSHDGEAAGDHNPNGAELDTAGLVSSRGNVLALMPHPERAAWLSQVPSWLPGPWGRRRREAARRPELLDAPGPGMAIFRALARAAIDGAGS